MKRLIVCTLLALPLLACNGPDLPTLLQYAQYGIDADCMFGKGALAADVCTFGGESIALAKAAAAKDPAQARSSVKQILLSAGQAKPALVPYVAWLTDAL